MSTKRISTQTYLWDRLKRRHYKVCEVGEKDIQLMDVLTGEKTPRIPMIAAEGDELLKPVGKFDIGKVLRKELARLQRQAKRMRLGPTEDFSPLTYFKGHVETYFRDALQLIGK